MDEENAAGGGTFLPTAVDAADRTVSANVRGPSTLVVLADTQVFPDVAAGYGAASAIPAAGFPDGTFRPEGPPDPGRVRQAPRGGARPRAWGPGVLRRRAGAGAWFAPFVDAGAAAGSFEGPGAFDPDGVVSRQELAVLRARALGLPASGATAFADAGQIAPWAAAGVQAAVAAGYLRGLPGGRFDPLDPATRAPAAVLALIVGHLAPWRWGGGLPGRAAGPRAGCSGSGTPSRGMGPGQPPRRGGTG